MEPFAKGLDSFMNQPVLCPFMNRYLIAQCKETWLDNTYKGMGSEHVGHYSYIINKDKGLTRLMMALLVDPWPARLLKVLRDGPQPSAIDFGLVRLLMAFGGRFWPCETLDDLRRSFFGHRQPFLALSDSCWPPKILFGLRRSFLAFKYQFWPL